MSPEYKLYLKGVPTAHIAAPLKVSTATMTMRLARERKANGYELYVPPIFISMKEVEEDKELILVMLADGITLSEVARKWEITRTTLRKHLDLWGYTLHSTAKDLPCYTLKEIADDWRNLEDEFLIKVARQPIFKVSRLIPDD